LNFLNDLNGSTIYSVLARSSFRGIRRAADLSALDDNHLNHTGDAPFPEKNRPGAKRENLYR